MKYVEYICTTILSADTSNGRINTGIYPTTATTFRVKGICKGYSQGHSIVGFTKDDAGSDSKDYRLFWYDSGRNLCFDWNGQRLQNSNWGGPSDGRLIDFTASNYNVYDNNNETYLLSGTPETTMSTTTIPIYVDVASWWLKSLEIWEGQTKVFDGKAAYDENSGNIGLYDSVSDSLKYNPNLTMTKGADLSTIFVSADKTTMPSSGGTINVTVNSETDWTASTTGNWFTMSSDSGTSADTAITITVPSTTSLTQVQDTITFTNATGDTDYLTIKQRKYNAGGGTYLMAIGGESVETFYIGGEQVDTIYLGSEIVYQSGPFVGLKMKSSVSFGKESGETFNLKITSSEPWTLSVDSNTTWLSASTLSGPTGDTTVVLETTSENDTQSARTTVITATTANFSATCEVTQQYFVSNYLFNYNAKEYDASTHSFPKTVGQSFNEDIILNTGVASASTDYATINGQYALKQYSSTAENPFNRGNGVGNDFTFIYKAKFNTNGSNIFANRGYDYNWMVRRTAFHYTAAGMSFTPSQEPSTIVITVDSNGNGVRKCIETNQIATDTVTYGGLSNAIGFFSGYGDHSAELFTGDFYWMFCANRKLTDDEINTVIYYNEHLNDEPEGE